MPERQPSVGVRISLFALLVVLLSPLAALFVLMVVSPAFARVVANGFGAIAVMMAIPGVMIARRLFSRNWRPPPGPSDGDGGGGGSGPREPDARPDAPRGGIPLPDAEQSRERIRDHDRAKRHRLRPRRPTPEPDRTPAPRVPHRSAIRDPILARAGRATRRRPQFSSARLTLASTASTTSDTR